MLEYSQSLMHSFRSGKRYPGRKEAMMVPRQTLPFGNSQVCYRHGARPAASSPPSAAINRLKRQGGKGGTRTSSNIPPHPHPLNPPSYPSPSYLPFGASPLIEYRIDCLFPQSTPGGELLYPRFQSKLAIPTYVPSAVISHVCLYALCVRRVRNPM